MASALRTSTSAARVARVEDDAIRSVLEDALSGAASAPVSLARLMLGMDRLEEVEDLLCSLSAGDRNSPFAEMARLVRDHRPGCEDAAAILHDHPELDGRLPPRAAIDECRRFFDRAVLLNEEASVAAYCLGDTAILDRCTREVMEVLDDWEALSPDRDALEIGCGIGRILTAVAPRLRTVAGVDISPNMIEAARRRCAGLPNVRLSVGSGKDLADFDDASLDLVLAVDSFPYIHRGGRDLVRACFQEIGRILRPGGELAMFNYSYRSSRDADRRDVRRLCDAFGFELLVPGRSCFALWDAEAYRIRLPDRSGLR